MVAIKSANADAFAARPDAATTVVLVYGPDAGLVSERVEAVLRASVDDIRDSMAVIRMAGDELAADPAGLMDEAQAIPMFGGRRAIWIRAGARGFLPALEGVLGATIRECRIVIEAGDLKANAPLRALCEKSPKAAAVPCYADEARDIQRLIDEEMRLANLSIAPDVRAELVPLLGGDRRASRNELRKLALYAHGQGSITVADIQEVIGDSSALALDRLVDACFAGEPRAIDTIESQFDNAMSEGLPAGVVIGAALRQASELHKMRLAHERGSEIADLVRQHRVHFKRESAVKFALSRWTSARLVNVMTHLAGAAFALRAVGLKPEQAIARSALFDVARSAAAQRR